MTPFVSCIMPTYARFPHYGHLVGEAVESFLRQDYPADRCELVILNDCDRQFLVLPDDCARGKTVRVIQTEMRYGSLGAKYNALVHLARGNLIMPWEDDDVSLSHRVSQGIRMLGDCDYWRPPQVIYMEDGGWDLSVPGWRWRDPVFHFVHNVGVRHHASVFTKSAWKKVGGYPAASGNQDALFDAALRRSCSVAPEGPLPMSEWAYIYCWGRSPVHLSGARDHEALYRRVGTDPVTPGRFNIVPAWRKDYIALPRAALPKES